MSKIKLALAGTCFAGITMLAPAALAAPAPAHTTVTFHLHTYKVPGTTTWAKRPNGSTWAIVNPNGSTWAIVRLSPNGSTWAVVKPGVSPDGSTWA